MSERQLIGGLVLAAIICAVALCALVSVTVGLATQAWCGWACASCIVAVALVFLLAYIRRRMRK